MSARTNVDAAARAYDVLLRAYPAAFRAAYGREMTQLFRDQWRDRRRQCGRAVDARFWLSVLWDVGRSAPALRLDALREDRRAGAHPGREGGTTRGMRGTRVVAGLAVVGGAFEVANTGVGFWGAGHPPRGAGEVLAVLLGMLLGVLLAAAGGTLWRGAPGARRVARGAAVACRALMVALQVRFPFMSIFARLLGVGLPLALLLTLRGRPGRSARAVA